MRRAVSKYQFPELHPRVVKNAALRDKIAALELAAAGQPPWLSKVPVPEAHSWVFAHTRLLSGQVIHAVREYGWTVSLKIPLPAPTGEALLSKFRNSLTRSKTPSTTKEPEVFTAQPPEALSALFAAAGAVPSEALSTTKSHWSPLKLFETFYSVKNAQRYPIPTDAKKFAHQQINGLRQLSAVYSSAYEQEDMLLRALSIALDKFGNGSQEVTKARVALVSHYEALDFSFRTLTDLEGKAALRAIGREWALRRLTTLLVKLRRRDQADSKRRQLQEVQTLLLELYPQAERYYQTLLREPIQPAAAALSAELAGIFIEHGRLMRRLEPGDLRGTQLERAGWELAKKSQQTNRVRHDLEYKQRVLSELADISEA